MLAAVLACCAPAVSAWSTIRPGISAAPRGGCRAVLGMSADVAAAASAVTDVRSAEALRRRLTVSISEEERAAGVLLPETLRVAADVVTQHGVVLLEGGLDSARCDDCRASAMRALDECVARLKARGVDYRTSFAYREVVHRAPLRYDVSLQPGTGLLPLPAQTGRALAEGLWQPLIRRLLGRDARHNFDGAFIALPGAGAQRPHMDGGHLFHSTHGFSLDVPVHIVNVFVPLVDTPLFMGPTEFWPGSHLAHAVPEVDQMPSVALEAEKGDVLVFDYRTFHRGLANNSPTEPRPVLYQTYSRSWFRDAHNFPEESLLTQAELEQREQSMAHKTGNQSENKTPAADAGELRERAGPEPSREDGATYHPQRGFAG